MTVGLNTANVANKWLSWLFGTSETAPAGTYVQLHTGDPGSAGTANGSAVTTRQSATMGSAASGSISLSGTPSWSMTATETISHISVWDASATGDFLFSVALSASKSVSNGDTFNLTTLTVSVSPLAA